jgi:tRNA(Ile)-lysidine synthase TilS/MesJ
MAAALASLALLLCLASPLDAYAAEAARPAWSDLTTAQRKILAPLQDEWPHISAAQRKRWMALADRYPRMSPAEQKRIQERMHDWAKLTPQQRDAARARYKALSKLTPEQRRTVIRQWTESQEAQQALPAETPPADSTETARSGEAPADGARPPETASGLAADKPAATP